MSHVLTLRDIAASLVLEPNVSGKIEILQQILSHSPTDEKNTAILLWNVAQTHTDIPILRTKCELVLTTFSVKSVLSFPPLGIWSTLLRIGSIHVNLQNFVFTLLPKILPSLSDKDMPQALELFVPEIVSILKDSIPENSLSLCCETVLQVLGPRCRSNALCKDLCEGAIKSLTQHPDRIDVKRSIARMLNACKTYLRLFRDECEGIIVQRKWELVDQFVVGLYFPELIPTEFSAAFLDAPNHIAVIILETYLTLRRPIDPALLCRWILAQEKISTMVLIPILKCLQQQSKTSIQDESELQKTIELCVQHPDTFVQAAALQCKYTHYPPTSKEYVLVLRGWMGSDRAATARSMSSSPRSSSLVSNQSMYVVPTPVVRALLQITPCDGPFPLHEVAIAVLDSWVLLGGGILEDFIARAAESITLKDSSQHTLCSSRVDCPVLRVLSTAYHHGDSHELQNSALRVLSLKEGVPSFSDLQVSVSSVLGHRANDLPISVQTSSKRCFVEVNQKLTVHSCCSQLVLSLALPSFGELDVNASILQTCRIITNVLSEFLKTNPPTKTSECKPAIDLIDLLLFASLSPDIGMATVSTVFECVPCLLRFTSGCALPKDVYERWVTIFHAYLIQMCDIITNTSHPTRVLPKHFPQSDTVSMQTLLEIHVPPTISESMKATFATYTTNPSPTSSFQDLLENVLRALGSVFRIPVMDCAYCTIAVPHNVSIIACCQAVCKLARVDSVMDCLRGLFIAMYGVIPSTDQRVPMSPESPSRLILSSVVRPSNKVPNRMQTITQIREVLEKGCCGDLCTSPHYMNFLQEMAWWDVSVKSRNTAYVTIDPDRLFLNYILRSVLLDPKSWSVYGPSVIEECCRLVYGVYHAAKEDTTNITQEIQKIYAVFGSKFDVVQFPLGLKGTGNVSPKAESLPLAVHPTITSKVLPFEPVGGTQYTEASVPHMVFKEMSSEELVKTLRTFPSLLNVVAHISFSPEIESLICQEIIAANNIPSLAYWLGRLQNTNLFSVDAPLTSLVQRFIEDNPIEELFVAAAQTTLPFTTLMILKCGILCLNLYGTAPVPDIVSVLPPNLAEDSLQMRLSLVLWMVWNLRLTMRTHSHPASLCDKLIALRPGAIVDEITYDGFDCLNNLSIRNATWIVANSLITKSMALDLHEKYTAHLLSVIPYDGETTAQTFIGLLRMATAFLLRRKDMISWRGVFCVQNKTESCIRDEVPSTPLSKMWQSLTSMMSSHTTHIEDTNLMMQLPPLDHQILVDVFTIWYTTVSTVLSSWERVSSECVLEVLLSMASVGLGLEDYPSNTVGAASDWLPGLGEVFASHPFTVGPWLLSVSSTLTRAGGCDVLPALTRYLPTMFMDEMQRTWGMAVLYSVAFKEPNFVCNTVVQSLEEGWVDAYAEHGTFALLQVLRVCYAIALESFVLDETRSTMVGTLWTRLGRVLVSHPTLSDRVNVFLHRGLQIMLQRYSLSHTQRDGIYAVLLDPVNLSRGSIHHTITSAVIIATNVTNGMDHARVHACDLLKMLPQHWTTAAGEVLSVLLSFLLGEVVESEHAIFLIINKFLHEPQSACLLLSLAMPKLLSMPEVDVVFDAFVNQRDLSARARLWVTIQVLHSLHSNEKPLLTYAFPTGTEWLAIAPNTVFEDLVKKTKRALRGCPDQVSIFTKLPALGEDLVKEGGEEYSRVAAICSDSSL